MRRNTLAAAAGLVWLVIPAWSDASHQGIHSPCCAAVFCAQSDSDPRCDNPHGGWACNEIAVGNDPREAGCIEPLPNGSTCAGGNPANATGCVCVDTGVPGAFPQCAAQGGGSCAESAVRGCREAGTAHCTNCAAPPCPLDRCGQ